jgi:hypothetical protein
MKLEILGSEKKGLKEAIEKYHLNNPSIVSENVALEVSGESVSGKIEKLGDTLKFTVSIDAAEVVEKVKKKVKKVVENIKAKKSVKKASKKK